MYIEYTTGNANILKANVVDDLRKTLDGTYTLSSQWQYGSGTIAGTAPTAGTWTFVDGSNGGYFDMIKKHIQWSAGTFEATTLVRFGSTNPNTNVNLYAMGSNNGANMWPTTDYGNVAGLGNWNIATTGTKFYIIFNDTSFVAAVAKYPTANPTTEVYVTTMMSDHQKNDFDDYCLSQNSLYYPGSLYVTGGQGATIDYQLQDLDKAASMIYKPQYRSTVGTNLNSNPGGNTSGAAYGFYAGLYNTIGYHSLIPVAYQRIAPIVVDGVTQPPLIPLMHNSMGISVQIYTTAVTSLTQDSRPISQMLNLYRTSDALGHFGDVVTTADGARYRLMRGHRVGGMTERNLSTNNYHPTCYLFPEDNVGV
jgi:hypothetical protein